MIFGKEGARRYAPMRAGDEKDAILQELLLQKSMQMVPYKEHNELPASFERLRSAVEAHAEQLTTRPPPEGATEPKGHEGTPAACEAA